MRKESTGHFWNRDWIWTPRNWNWNWNWNVQNWNWNWNWNFLWVVELELELELKITELELELNWKNGIDPNPGYGIFSEVGTAILAGSVLQNLYYLSPSGAIVTSQWGHLVACGAGIALDREYQCRSLYGLENWAFITNACTNAKDFTCSKLNWNDVPRFMLPAVFY